MFKRIICAIICTQAFAWPVSSQGVCDSFLRTGFFETIRQNTNAVSTSTIERDFCRFRSEDIVSGRTGSGGVTDYISFNGSESENRKIVDTACSNEAAGNLDDQTRTLFESRLSPETLQIVRACRGIDALEVETLSTGQFGSGPLDVGISWNPKFQANLIIQPISFNKEVLSCSGTMVKGMRLTPSERGTLSCSRISDAAVRISIETSAGLLLFPLPAFRPQTGFDSELARFDRSFRSRLTCDNYNGSGFAADMRALHSLFSAYIDAHLDNGISQGNAVSAQDGLFDLRSQIGRVADRQAACLDPASSGDGYAFHLGAARAMEDVIGRITNALDDRRLITRDDAVRLRARSNCVAESRLGPALC